MDEKLNIYDFENELEYISALNNRYKIVSSRGYDCRGEAAVGDHMAVKIYKRTFGRYRMHNHNFYKPEGWAVEINGTIVFADTIKNLKQKLTNKEK
jgi:hypothetical protein